VGEQVGCPGGEGWCYDAGRVICFDDNFFISSWLRAFLCRPFRSLKVVCDFLTRGDALGYYMAPLWSF